jgi:predicted small lipoprotein YifL
MKSSSRSGLPAVTAGSDRDIPHSAGVSLANDIQSGKVREISERALSRPNRLPSFVPVIAALALAFVLGACGRKGALDPPPGGYAIEQQQGKTPVTRKGEARTTEKPADYDEDGRPIAPEGRKKKLPADWLID